MLKLNLGYTILIRFKKIIILAASYNGAKFGKISTLLLAFTDLILTLNSLSIILSVGPTSGLTGLLFIPEQNVQSEP